MEVELDYDIIDPVVKGIKEEGSAVLSLQHEIARIGGAAELYVSEIKHLVAQLFEIDTEHRYLSPEPTEAVRLHFRAA